MQAELPLRQLRNALGIGLLDVVPVDPVQLLPVEDRGRRGYALQREKRSQLLEREELRLAVFRTPAQQRQVVRQRLGQIAHLPERRNSSSPMTLRQLLPVCAQHGGQMRKLGNRPAESLVRSYLRRRVR